MKKVKFLSIGLIALFVLTFAGCDSGNADKAELLPQKSQNELISSLKNFNNELLSDRPMTRGRHWLEVAWYDIRCARDGARAGGRIGSYFGPKGALIGAVAGGLITGAAGSYALTTVDASMDYYDPTLNIGQLYDDYIRLLEINYELSIEYIESAKTNAEVELALPERYAYLEDIGVRHNALLMALDGNKAVPKQEIIYSEDDSIALEIIQTEEFKAAYQNTLYSTLEEITNVADLNIEQRIDYYIMEEDNPVAQQVMELFQEAYLTYPDKMMDIDFIINNYIRIIEASNEIAEKEKEALYTGFSVAAYSPRFWYNVTMHE